MRQQQAREFAESMVRHCREGFQPYSDEESIGCMIAVISAALLDLEQRHGAHVAAGVLDQIARDRAGEFDIEKIGAAIYWGSR